nr:retrovirus-related Pol polyprotein from transposon TNT 1-94 [Tanacetum cinerariifolium]
MQTTEKNVVTSKALDASLVNTKSSGTISRKNDTSSSSGNDVDADDADIKPVYDEEPMAEYFLEYTQLEIREFCDTLIQHMEYVKKLIDKRALHQREYDNMVDERKMQTIEGKDTSSSPGNDVDADDAVIETINIELEHKVTNTAKPKNIKEAMADSAWIEAMQEELHHFDRLQVWELVDKPLGKTVIKLKWLWKNKKDEDQTVIRNKARLVAKGYAHEEDADHAGCIDSRKSTYRGIQFLGDKLVSWMSKKQNCTAMSSTEAEYVALSVSCAQVIWMRTQLQDYGFNYNKILLYCDSQSAITISCNLVQHSRTKHIHTRYHFIKEHVENGIIELYFVRTEYQLTDMFTKALPKDRFKYLVRRIGMRCLTPVELEVMAKESA